MRAKPVAKPTLGASRNKPDASRRAVNVTLPQSLITQARDAEINLSRFFEEQLTARLKTEQTLRWQQENRAAIEHFNARITRDGVWGDDDTRPF